MILESSCIIPVGCSQRVDLIKYMSVPYMVLFSSKPSCTSDEGSLKYAGLLLSFKYLFFLWWLFFGVTLWDCIYYDQSKLFTLYYRANSHTKSKKIKIEIYISTLKYVFIHELGSARLKVTERVVR